MAKPTAPTEAGGSKIVILADSTAGTPGAEAPVAVQSSTSSEATYPVGWMGVATHRDDDTVTQPGGFTGLATAKAPVVMVGAQAGPAGTTVVALHTDTTAPGASDEGLVVRNIPTGTQAVSGTVTINAIPAGSNNIGDVDVLTVPAPLSTTGGGTEAAALRVTVATDSTGVLSVDDNGGSLTVDGTVAVSGSVAVTGPLTDAQLRATPVPISGSLTANQSVNLAQVAGTATDTNSGAKSAGTQRVVIATDQPQLTNALKVDGSAVTQPISGTVTATGPLTDTQLRASAVPVSGPLTDTQLRASAVPVTLTSTTITSEIPGVGATNLGKAEDAAHTTGDTGVMALAVRNDGGSVLAGTDLDYVPLTTDNTGALRVTGGSGGTQYAEDSAHVSGDTLTLAGVVQQSADSALSSDGDRSLLQVDATGYLKVNVKAGATAGTQYTEDAASAADPVGNQLITRRRDSLATETTTDGDNTALNSTGKGELYVKHVDAIPITDNAGSLTVDNAIISVVGSGTEATAQRVTIATDSTGVLSVDDNGGSLTVDGTVAVSGSVAVTNAALSVVGGGVEATALRVTVATDSTGVLSVDDNGGSLTVDGTITANAGTGTFTTSDTATQVDDAAFTPATGRVMMAGATFDDVAPDSVNEGDGGALRMSANRNLYGTIRDAAGNERGVNVSAGNALLVDASATTQPISGAVTNTVLSVVGGGTEATAQRVTLASDSTGQVKLATGANTIGALTANQSVNVAQVNGVTTLMGNGVSGTGAQRVTLASDSTGQVTLATGANTIGAVTNTVLSVVGNGTAATAQRVTLASDSTGIVSLATGANTIGALTANQSVNVAQVNGVTPLMGAGNTGTGSPRVTIATDQAVIPVGGNVAHDGVDSGNPQKIGYKAIAHNVAPTAVSAADRTDAYANRHGIQFVIGGHPKIERLRAKYTTAQTDTVLKTINAGQIFVVTQCSAFVAHSTTVDVGALFEFDDTADVPFSEHPGIAPGSGYTEGDGSGIIAIGADAQDVLITVSVPTTGSVVVSVSGYVIES